MTPAAKKKPLWKEIFSKKMLLNFWLGFSSGLPFLLTGSTLKMWLARENIDLSLIGYLTWVSMSYSLKFLWAPLLDRYALTRLGRRRSWMLLSQIALMLSIAGMGLFDPKTSLNAMVVMAILTGFFSATQDIAIDAFRREYLAVEELGFGSSMSMYGYRIAWLVSGALGIGMVGTDKWQLSWNQLYFAMGALMIIGMVTTLFAPEPAVDVLPPTSLRAAVTDPFKDFLKRPGAWTILLFILLYKFGDAVGLAVVNPYYVAVGYTNADIALIAKTFGLISSLVGFFLGSTVMYYFGMYRSLWLFGILQALSVEAFALLIHTGPERWSLAVVVLFEDICTSMASAVFISFIAAVTNKRFTATQYALLASVATLGRNFFSGFSGALAKSMGWDLFFFCSALLAIPGLVMLYFMRNYEQTYEAE